MSLTVQALQPLPVRRSGPGTYALSLVFLVAAVLIRWLLDPHLGDALPLVTLFGAVAGAVWIGGTLPALLVAVLGYLACDFLFMDPRGQIGVLGNASSLIGAIAYAFTCVLIVMVGEVARRAQHAAVLRHEVLWVTLRSIGDAVIATDLR